MKTPSKKTPSKNKLPAAKKSSEQPTEKSLTPENNLTFDISDIYHADIGQSHEFHLEVSEDFDPKDFVLVSDIRTDVVLMKTEDAISVQLENFTYDIQETCCRCLKTCSKKILIPHAERDFLFLRPKDIADIEDVYTADLKRLEVDLHNMFRQEILLHFDAFPVCSPSCRGLCPVCGKDLNKAKCGHKPVEQVDDSHDQEESVKPFQNLKSIIQHKR